MPRCSRTSTTPRRRIGGYVWAQAGFTPRDWTALKLQVEARLAVLRRRGTKLGEEEAFIRQVLTAGEDDPRAIRALATRSMQVPSSNMRDPNDPRQISLGKELLIGSRWNGELVLDDEDSMRIFSEWRKRWETAMAKAADRRSISSPSPGHER